MTKEQVSVSEISATPMAQLSAAARQLVSYWNESRLRAAEAKSASVRATPGVVPWHTALEEVLKVGYGAQTQSRFVDGAWELIRWRTTPSAGALYPFEVIASVIGEANYLWDVEKGLLAPCCLAPLTRDDLAKAGIVTPPGQRPEALLILVARPWLSMKKYRLRGYAYTHLDVGHTATNLAIYTAALGHAPTVHLRFSRAALAGRLELDGLCREPLAVLSFAGSRPAADRGPAAGLDVTGPGLPGLARPEEPEVRNWEALRALISAESSLEPRAVPASARLVAEPAEVSEDNLLPLPIGRPQTSAREWRSAILGRRSAKGFYGEPLRESQVGKLLSALRTASLPADCSPEDTSRLGVRLIARNVEGLSGVYAYSARSHALHFVDSQVDDPRPACMQQEVAGDAAALLIFHAPVARLFNRHGYSAFAELFYHAAQMGQLLHLAAARLGPVGMTCLGGFDGEESAALARLEGDEETVYVILLGVPNDAAFKYDRLGVAYSHGYTTQEG